MGADFSGWATRSNLKCSDGRVIKPNAFTKQNGAKVPLVWQHMHGEPSNVLGHAILEDRDGDVYAYCYFNNGAAAQEAKIAVQHKDVESLSIYANKLVQKGKEVLHGVIREVSLVLSGANPGALIDNVSIAHADGYQMELDDEAVIYTGLKLEHEDKTDEKEEEMADSDNGKTVKDVFDSMSEEQKNAVYFMIGEALKGDDAKHDSLDDDDADDDDESEDEDLQHNEKGKGGMPRNVFEQNGSDTLVKRHKLTAEQTQEIIHDAMRVGSLKESVLAHTVSYGIEDIDLLFPDAKALTNQPDWVKRNTEWVAGVLGGTKHTPFSRIKTLSADLTYDTARALGYIKGNEKKEEFFKISKRETTPKTIYKKQKLDRDDIIDITDLDVVAWMKAEMRMMLDEEIARAILIGDGRDFADQDKISEENIRPIAKDDNFYAHATYLAANVTAKNLVKSVVRARRNYKGSGTPTFFTTESILTEMLLTEDRMGRRLYETEQALAAALRVSKIVTVEVMEGMVDDYDNALMGIVVNLTDYTVGADKGGQISMFDDFDIDFNQYKYLMETRISGALTKPKSALVFWRHDGTEVTPTAPTFIDNEVAFPSITGVGYYDSVEDPEYQTDLSGTTVTLTDEVNNNHIAVVAVPDDTYFFTPNVETMWEFDYDDNVE